MDILIVGPVLSSRGRGNRTTAVRWGRILEHLGHDVSFDDVYRGQPCEVLVALHAIWSADSIAAFREKYPERPVVLALSGTDIYGFGEMFEEEGRAAARRSMEMATRLVAFQPLAFEQVEDVVRDKGVVIHQSAEPLEEPPQQRDGIFEVCVVGEIREVKDPFRTALAARRLPSPSMVRVLHIGAAGSDEIAERAMKEEQSNARYTWLGEISPRETMELIGRCRLVSISSRHEGGPNVLAEALSLGVPVVATRIPGISGILGDNYPGYFDVKDTEALCKLLRRAETEPDFYESLRLACMVLSELTSPARERQAWTDLLGGL